MVSGTRGPSADRPGRRSGSALRVLGAVSAVAGLVMLASAAWITAVFGSITTQQLLDVVEGRTQLDGGGPGLLVSFLLVCLLAPVLAVAGAVGAAVALRGRARVEPPVESSHRRPGALLAPSAGVLVLVLGAGLLLDRVQFWPYLEAARFDGSVAEYYVAGQTLPASVERPATNLIMIYLESFEQAYESPEIMGEDLLGPLTDATEEWMRWDSLEQQPGTGWTIAGIVASQCGIPLKNEGLEDGLVDRNALGEAEERFLPGAVCLGDVLEQHGYRSVFLGGADAGFAGKGKFLEQHGYDEVLDRRDWQCSGARRISTPGACPTIGCWRTPVSSSPRCVRQDRPYNLTLLTVDSHEPGLVGPACEQGDDGPVRAAVRCTADEVAGFLADIEREGVLEDTAVVVMGDHLAMIGATSELADELQDAPRGVFHRATTPLDVEPVPGPIDHFSILPTTLELLGLPVPGGRLGLGRSAVNPAEGRPPAPVDAPPSLYALPPEQRRLVLEAPSSAFYARLWNPEGAVAGSGR